MSNVPPRNIYDMQTIYKPLLGQAQGPLVNLLFTSDTLLRKLLYHFPNKTWHIFFSIMGLQYYLPA